MEGAVALDDMCAGAKCSCAALTEEGGLALEAHVSEARHGAPG
jgi:hypothetical protein